MSSLRENSSSGGAEPLPGIFSVVFNRNGGGLGPGQSPSLLTQYHWPSFSMAGRSFWTKYCLLCTICGSAATILAGIFLVVAALFRYYTTSIYYFETVPTYIPAILLSICGVSTIAFSCKRNRNIILLRITACWSLVSAALSSVITITTSLIHMNRLQTLKECVYNRNPPSCTCFGHSYAMEGPITTEPVHYVFENTSDCDVIHGALYSCLRAVFAISVVAVLLSIFLCMLLYQLIGHERKKAYWSRIRRINSDWSSDFLACLARPMPRERSSLMPLMLSTSGSFGGGPALVPLQPHGFQWGPPPAYEALAPENLQLSTRRPPNHTTPNFIALPPTPPTASTTNTLRSAHPFSPTILSLNPMPGPSSRDFAPNADTQAPITNQNIQNSTLRLRESKISIQSDSDNLYSQDEESFAEKRIFYEPKVVNVNVQILDRNSSSVFDFLEKGLSPGPERRPLGHMTSLPSSPFLTNMKRMFRGVATATSPSRGLVPWNRRTSFSNLDFSSAKATSLPGSPLKLSKVMGTSQEGSLVKDNELC